MLIDYQIDVRKKDNFDVLRKRVDNTIIQEMERLMCSQEYGQKHM